MVLSPKAGMLHYPSLFIFVLLIVLPADAQRKPIRAIKTPGNVHYEYDTLTLSAQQVKQLLLEEPEAHRYFRQARLHSACSRLLGAAGGTVLAIAVINSLLNSQVDVNTAVVGSALVVASLPFEVGYRRRAAQAIDRYNEGVSARLQPALFWRGKVVGLQVRF